LWVVEPEQLRPGLRVDGHPAASHWPEGGGARMQAVKVCKLGRELLEAARDDCLLRIVD
jgi:hypothetical protein